MAKRKHADRNGFGPINQQILPDRADVCVKLNARLSHNVYSTGLFVVRVIPPSFGPVGNLTGAEISPRSFSGDRIALCFCNSTADRPDAAGFGSDSTSTAVYTGRSTAVIRKNAAISPRSRVKTAGFQGKRRKRVQETRSVCRRFETENVVKEKNKINYYDIWASPEAKNC